MPAARTRIALKMEATSASETSVNTYQTSRPNNPEDRNSSTITLFQILPSYFFFLSFYFLSRGFLVPSFSPFFLLFDTLHYDQSFNQLAI
jgi:hypothetical protein